MFMPITVCSSVYAGETSVKALFPQRTGIPTYLDCNGSFVEGRVELYGTLSGFCGYRLVQQAVVDIETSEQDPWCKCQ